MLKNVYCNVFVLSSFYSKLKRVTDTDQFNKTGVVPNNSCLFYVRTVSQVLYSLLVHTIICN